MKIKAAGREYPMPEKRMELGLSRFIKKEYGVVFARDDFDLNDPDYCSAFLFRAMLEAEPEADLRSIVARVSLVSEIEFIAEPDDGAEEEVQADPPTEPAKPEPTAEETTTGS